MKHRTRLKKVKNAVRFTCSYLVMSKKWAQIIHKNKSAIRFLIEVGKKVAKDQPGEFPVKRKKIMFM